MSAKPETTFYTAVHRLLPEKLHREKMHNPYRGGTPDVWYSGNADDLWVEYKYVKAVPKKAPILISKELSALQLKWLNDRAKEGRNVAVILGTPLGAVVYEHRSWETRAVTADEIRSDGLTKQQVANYITGRTMLTCP